MCIDKMRYIMIGCALALIALAGCKTPELSMDERISLPESGEMGMNDTTFVKPLSWDVFFQDTLLRGYVDVALRNNHSFQQSMERIATIPMIHPKICIFCTECLALPMIRIPMIFKTSMLITN